MEGKGNFIVLGVGPIDTNFAQGLTNVWLMTTMVSIIICVLNVILISFNYKIIKKKQFGLILLGNIINLVIWLIAGLYSGVPTSYFGTTAMIISILMLIIIQITIFIQLLKNLKKHKKKEEN